MTTRYDRTPHHATTMRSAQIVAVGPAPALQSQVVGVCPAEKNSGFSRSSGSVLSVQSVLPVLSVLLPKRPKNRKGPQNAAKTPANQAFSAFF